MPQGNGPAGRAGSLRRDAGFERLRRTTTWLGVGAVALVGVCSAAVAIALPGHGSSATRTTPSSTPPIAPTAPAPTSPASPNQLQPPAAPPSTTPPTTAPQAVSGAS